MVELGIVRLMIGDHCWGNQLLPSSAKIYAMKKIAVTLYRASQLTRLRNYHTEAFSSPYSERWFKTSFTSRFDHSTVEVRRPDIPLEESTTLKIGGKDIELLYLGPTHTDGDMVAYVPESKVLLAGDLFFFKACSSKAFG